MPPADRGGGPDRRLTEAGGGPRAPGGSGGSRTRGGSGGPRGSGRHSWQRHSLRARLTLVSTGLAALGLVVGGALLVLILRSTLLRAVDNAARGQAADVATLLAGGRLPDPIPVGGGAAVVQVVDSGRRVVAASAGGDHLVPLLSATRLRRVRAGAAVDMDGARIGSADPLRVIGSPATGGSTVLVAVPLIDVQRSTRALELVVLAGVPLLLVVIAGTTWRVTGSALRPVAQLREGADRISAAAPAGSRSADGPALLPLPAAQDEIRRLAETLNRMLERVASGSVRQRAFVADAAHELRSPLASIRTSLEVGLHHPQVADWPETARDALLDVDRMSRLVDDLLVLARLDDATPHAPREPVDLVRTVDRVLARSNAGGGSGGGSGSGGSGGGGGDGGRVRLRRTGLPAAVVAGDADALTRVVANLVDNAVAAARSEVVVDLAAQGDELVLTVRDDGPGIPTADRDRVFERFARLDTARGRGTGGSGLGLPIARALVQAAGGRIELADAGPGLLAVVRLPPAAADR